MKIKCPRGARARSQVQCRNPVRPSLRPSECIFDRGHRFSLQHH
ncbi:rCG50967 [Rattus norvegicus]|uniref:RCG50967 n=1 Tax=Rattus norvegicus TaxID=10116 RepID=A6KGE6_RAT|nr:rCG50967 [Rattus norvegicus]